MRPRRIVSLVPSLTEAIASVAADLLVGATDYCTHPADLDVVRVGGSKFPRVPDVVALGDLVNRIALRDGPEVACIAVRSETAPPWEQLECAHGVRAARPRQSDELVKRWAAGSSAQPPSEREGSYL